MPLAPARKPNPDHTTEWDDPAMMARAQRAALKRAASGKRRRVDPCTIDRIYSADEWEFAVAMRAYILTSGRKFPAWSEVLEVLKSLGYAKPPEIVRDP